MIITTKFKPIITRSFLILLGVFCFSGNLLSQYYRVLPENEKEQQKNSGLLYSKAIFMASGDYPFQENGKWGFKDDNGNVVAQPIYDSLIGIGEDHHFCIAVKKGQYEILNDKYQSCLQIPMPKIVSNFYTREFVVTDFDNKITRYTIGVGNRLYSQDTPNYLVPQKAVSWSEKERQDKLMKPYTEYLDSIFVSPLIWRTEELSKLPPVRLYLKNKKVIEYSNYEWKGPVGDRYVELKSGDTIFIVNYITGDTLHRIEGKGGAEFFENEGISYIWVVDFSKERTFIYSIDGSLMHDLAGYYPFMNGFLMFQNNDPKHTCDIYSFPDLKKVDSLLIPHNSINDSNRKSADFSLFREYNNSNYRLYFKETPIYFFKAKHTHRLEIDRIGYSHLIGLEHRKKSKSSCVRLFSDDGFLVYESKYSRNTKDVVFIPNSTMFKITKGYEGKVLAARFYDTINHTVTVLNNTITNQLSNSIYVTTTDEKMRFSDANGQTIGNEEYDNLTILLIGAKKFAETRMGEKFSVLNESLQPICTSCIIADGLCMGLNGKNPSCLIIYDQNANRYRIYNQNGQLISPDSFLAATCYSPNTVVVLTEQYQLAYFAIK